MIKREREPAYSTIGQQWQSSNTYNQQQPNFIQSHPPPQQIISPLQVNYSSAGHSAANTHQTQPSNYTFNLQRQPSAGRFTPPQPSSGRPFSSHHN